MTGPCSPANTTFGRLIPNLYHHLWRRIECHRWSQTLGGAGVWLGQANCPRLEGATGGTQPVLLPILYAPAHACLLGANFLWWGSTPYLAACSMYPDTCLPATCPDEPYPDILVLSFPWSAAQGRYVHARVGGLPIAVPAVPLGAQVVQLYTPAADNLVCLITCIMYACMVVCHPPCTDFPCLPDRFSWEEWRSAPADIL